MAECIVNWAPLCVAKVIYFWNRGSVIRNHIPTCEGLRFQIHTSISINTIYKTEIFFISLWAEIWGGGTWDIRHLELKQTKSIFESRYFGVKFAHLNWNSWVALVLVYYSRNQESRIIYSRKFTIHAVNKRIHTVCIVHIDVGCWLL